MSIEHWNVRDARWVWNFCRHCVDPDQTGQQFLSYCGTTKKYYCYDCVPESKWNYCDECLEGKCRDDAGGLYCKDCGVVFMCSDCACTCEVCGQTYCDGCAPDIECENCEKVICKYCDDGDIYSIKHCDECAYTLCSSCEAGSCDCKKE